LLLLLLLHLGANNSAPVTFETFSPTYLQPLLSLSFLLREHHLLSHKFLLLLLLLLLHHLLLHEGLYYDLSTPRAPCILPHTHIVTCILRLQLLLSPSVSLPTSVHGHLLLRKKIAIGTTLIQHPAISPYLADVRLRLRSVIKERLCKGVLLCLLPLCLLFL
jgi:hypothetical protein